MTTLINTLILPEGTRNQFLQLIASRSTLPYTVEPS